MPFAGTINQLGSRMGVGDRGATVLERSIPVLGYGENFSLYGLAGLQAYYDALTASSVTYAAATGAASAWADLSGMGHNLLQATGANQPIYLPWSGTNYGWLPGVSGNNLSTPNSAALQLTGNIDFRVQIQKSSWANPASAQDLMGKWEATAAASAYMFRWDSAGTLRIFNSTGAAVLSAPSTVTVASLGLTTNGIYWLRGTFVPNDGAAHNVANFYYSTDNATWTQIGATVTTAGATTIATTTGALRVGESGNGSPVTGNIYRAQIYNGIAGTLVFDMNPALASDGATTFLDAAGGATITVNQALPGKPALIVGRPGLLFDGSAAFLKTAPFVLNQPTWVVLVGRRLAWANSKYVFDGNAADSMGLYSNTTTPNVTQYSGADGATLTAWTVGTTAIVTDVINGATSYLQLNNGTKTANGNPGVANAGGFTLGTRGDGAATFSNILVNAVCIWNVQPTASDIARVVQYFASRWNISV